MRSWLAMLIAPLDCYSWVFSERLLSPQVILGASSSSCIWSSLQYFLDNLVNYDLEDVVRRICRDSRPHEPVVCTPHEIGEFKKVFLIREL